MAVLAVLISSTNSFQLGTPAFSLAGATDINTKLMPEVSSLNKGPGGHREVALLDEMGGGEDVFGRDDLGMILVYQHVF